MKGNLITNHMKNSTFLVTCPVFQEELDASLPYDSKITVYTLNYRIHANAQLMKKELMSAIAGAREIDAEICILLGCECNCDISIKEIAGDAKAKYPLEKNCIEIILGPKKAKELQANRTSIFTRGWMNLVKRYIEDGAWTVIDARINLGYYDRVLLLEYEMAPFTDEEILEFYDLIQVPIEREQISLHYFEGVLCRLLGRAKLG